MPGFIDVSCPKCNRKHGWFGEMVQRPACPRCGHQVDPKKLTEVQAKMDEMERLLLTRPKDAKGRDLMEMRKMAGLTVRQAAVQLGVKPSDLSDWEWGRVVLPADVAAKMEATYGCGD